MEFLFEELMIFSYTMHPSNHTQQPSVNFTNQLQNIMLKGKVFISKES